MWNSSEPYFLSALN